MPGDDKSHGLRLLLSTFLLYKLSLMNKSFTLNNIPAGYEICGVGATPEEDSLVVMSNESIKKLRKSKPGFFKSLFSGPYVLSGTGADYKESGFMIQEMIERGHRK